MRAPFSPKKQGIYCCKKQVPGIRDFHLPDTFLHYDLVGVDTTEKVNYCDTCAAARGCGQVASKT